VTLQFNVIFMDCLKHMPVCKIESC